MLAQRLNLVLVMQHARTFDDEIDLFLAVVKYGLAIAMWIQQRLRRSERRFERIGSLCLPRRK